MSNKQDNGPFWAMVKGGCVWLAIIGLVFGLSFLGVKQWHTPYKEGKSYEATLVQAYEYQASTGKYSSTTKYKGRFKDVSSGEYYTQDIDGFFYQNFVEGGRKDIPSWIVLTDEDRGIEAPWYGAVCWFIAFFSAVLFFTALVMTPIIACMEQSEWEWRQRLKRFRHTGYFDRED